MYIVQLHTNCPFFDHMKVAETKIIDAAAKNAPGIPWGGPGPPLGLSEGPGNAL